MANRPRRIDDRVEMGPVHLAVANLDRALAFYEGVLGLEAIERIGDAAVFLSVNGSERHVGLNTWNGTAPTATPCVHHFALRYPTPAALAAALRDLDAAGVAVETATDYHSSQAIYVRDPDGNGIELFVRPARQNAAGDGDGDGRAPLPLDLDALRKLTDDPEAPGTRAEGAGQRVVLSDETKTRLRDMRIRLLNLHKVLLEDAKAAYEMDRGRVASNASLLQLVINDPWFAWLQPLSGLVVRIDEALRADSPASETDGEALFNEVTRLLSPDHGPGEFARHYYDALQRQPGVVVAHAEVRRILKQPR